MCSELFSVFISFVIIGCPMSTDLDVVCIVDSKYQSYGKTYSIL